MRIVRSHDELDENLEACKREALASFGDERVLLERYIVRPRHIEFQVRDRRERELGHDAGSAYVEWMCMPHVVLV